MCWLTATSIRSFCFICMAPQPPVGQNLLIIEASRSHSDTPHTLIGLLWTSDQPNAETSTWPLTTDRHPCPGGIRTRNPNRWAAADPRLRPRGHWDCTWSDLLNWGLFNDAFNIPTYTASNDNLVCVQWIGKNYKGSGRSPICDYTPELGWKNCLKPRCQYTGCPLSPDSKLKIYCIITKTNRNVQTFVNCSLTQKVYVIFCFRSAG